MAKPFVTVDKSGRYDPSIGAELGALGYRLTFDLRILEQPDYLKRCIKGGLETLLCADTDSYPGVNWEAVRANPNDVWRYEGPVSDSIGYYRRWYDGLITYLSTGNEWNDTGVEGSRMPSQVANQITRMWRDAFPQARIILPSDVSGNPESIAELEYEDGDRIDAHLYAKAPYGWSEPMTGYLLDSVAAYLRRWPGRKLVVSEIGISSNSAPAGWDAREYQAFYIEDVATELSKHREVELFTIYAMQNWGGFGLLDDDDKPKPSYWYFRNGSQYWVGEPLPPSPRTDVVVDPSGPSYQGGFATIAAKYPDLLGAALEQEQQIVPGYLHDQRTANGHLTWARIADGRWPVYSFTDRATGTRYKWTDAELRGDQVISQTFEAAVAS